MTTISFQDDQVIFQLSGMRRLLAFRASITVPRSAIVGARHDPSVRPKGWRAPGTHVPGIFAGGTFHEEDGQVFWNVADPARAIVVELRGAEFTALVIEVDDVAGALQQLNHPST